MNTRSLFLAWQDRKSRQWFPVGVLDVDGGDHPLYRFRYTGGAERARKEAQFSPLIEFPRLDGHYKSSRLFPLFGNRVIARGRPDRADYLSDLDLAENADPVEILSVNGGRRVTDAYEVFPKLAKRADGSFACRFFLHGWRYTVPSAQERMNGLEQDEELHIALELTNPVTRLAVQIQTKDYHMIGWAPRYLVNDLAAAMAEPPSYSAHVARVNPQPAPSRQRLLIEMRGRWSEHEPMTGEDFIPLAE